MIWTVVELAGGRRVLALPLPGCPFFLFFFFFCWLHSFSSGPRLHLFFNCLMKPPMSLPLPWLFWLCGWGGISEEIARLVGAWWSSALVGRRASGPAYFSDRTSPRLEYQSSIVSMPALLSCQQCRGIQPCCLLIHLTR
ncbi:hypothetical protein BGW36DRAFT_174954 [Talaromyces proteolyticus]|uniref:Uncharacterized protein n=1 Tax=Talaromyces proteolyticus TaxID=1131652 RepID=A0AAD4KRQ5_9EURO|nr:uncharacterized protein BGW36DRAFT_174954 [Talaromyces proteolyticus]KAH8697774.1 hypothetical protein BGW36DRAFT_174954 [Talaromyces proteolyticus]